VRRALLYALTLLMALPAQADERQASPTQIPIKPLIKSALPIFKLDRPAEQGNIIIGQAPTGALSLSLDGQPVKLAADGAFLIAFHRDAAATAKLTALMADGSTALQDISITPRVYDEQQVNGLPPRTVTLSPADELRRKGEVAKIVASRATKSELQGWRQHFIWPGSPHFGVDVARPTGTMVVAPADGVVVLAEPDMLMEGGLLIIDHGFGLFTDYLHLSRLDVKVGAVLKQGQPIGAIGATGRATGPHLHWGMRWAATRLDPSKLVAE
jgi:murein DD-endopeptidase MepM/ murein hydrolase activator NlpD